MKKWAIACVFVLASSLAEAQWEIRGPDQICSNTTFQLYNNGFPNTENIIWEYTTYANPQNQVNFTNISNSSVAISIANLATGCYPSQTVCCYPPRIRLNAKLASTNQVVASREHVLLGCNSFPITGQTSTIPFPNPSEPNGDKVVYIFFINGTVAQNGRNCYGGSEGYTVWNVSNNLKIEDSTWIRSNKITITRIAPGQGFLDLYFGDGLAYRKVIQY